MRLREIERELELGDHSVVVGATLELNVVGSGRPLVFFRGGYPAPDDCSGAS